MSILKIFKNLNCSVEVKKNFFRMKIIVFNKNQLKFSNNNHLIILKPLIKVIIQIKIHPNNH